MEALAIARLFHVLSIVLWIGGVGFVTLALIPGLRSVRDPAQRMPLFQMAEHRFAHIARACILVAGASGFYMVVKLDAWDRFAMAGWWWMDAMVLVWLIFTVMLFIVEPTVLHRRLGHLAAQDPDATFRAMQRFHWFMLLLSLLTIAGAVAGSHGWVLFG